MSSVGSFVPWIPLNSSALIGFSGTVIISILNWYIKKRRACEKTMYAADD